MKFTKKQVLKKSIEEIKEETVKQEILTEAVDKKRTYNYDNVATTIASVLQQHGYNVVDEIDSETDLENKIIKYDDILDEFAWINSSGFEINSEEVDSAVEKLANYFKLTPEEIQSIEDAINKSHGDYASERRDDYDSDIRTLEDLLDEDYDRHLYSKKVKEELAQLIYKLKHANYTGLEKE